MAPILYFLVFTNNIFIFFIFYEILLLISTVLIYFFSPNIRSKNIALYFLFWTQFGSFLFLLSITFTYLFTGFQNFYILKNSNYPIIIQIIFFIGLATKIPTWPF